MTPDIYLIRPAEEPEHMLSNVLLDRAKAGVTIRILIWNSILPLVIYANQFDDDIDIESVSPIKHIIAKDYLEALHSNIKVLDQA